MFDPNAPLPDFQTQQQELEAQRAMAEQLRRVAGSAQKPQAQMVGNRMVAPNFLEFLGPMLAQYQAGQAGRQADETAKGLSSAAGQARQNWQSSLPQATAGRAELPGPPDAGGSPELAAVAPTQPSRGQILKATLAGMNIPGNQGAASVWNQAMNADLTREDAQADKRESAAAKAKADKEALVLQLEQKAEAARLRSEDTRLVIEQRREAAAQMMELLKQRDATLLAIASMKIGAAADKPLKNLPSAQSKAWIENNTALSNLDAAEVAVKAYPNAFGVKNYLGDPMMQRVDPNGVDARTIVADIGSLKVHDRSGAAVSAAEDKRLAPFIPRAEDSPATVIKKLAQFRRVYMQINQEILDYAESQGYKPPTVTRGVAAPAGAKPPPGLVLPPGAIYVGPAP